MFYEQVEIAKLQIAIFTGLSIDRLQKEKWQSHDNTKGDFLCRKQIL